MNVQFADPIDSFGVDGKRDIQNVVECELENDRHSDVASTDLDVPTGGALLGGRRRRRKRGKGLLGGRKRKRSHSRKRRGGSKKRIGSKGAWQRCMKAAVKHAAAKYRRSRGRGAMLY